MQCLELPDAALLHEGVFVNSLAPGGLPAIHPDHVQLTAARTRGQPAGSHIDDRLQLQMIVHLSPPQPWRPPQPEELADVTLAHIEAGLAPLHRPVAGEQIRGLIPHRPIDVVAVDALQVFDLLLILEEHGAVREIFGARQDIAVAVGRRAFRRRCPNPRGRRIRARILVMKRRYASGGKPVALHVPLSIRRMRQLAPARWPRTRRLRWDPPRLIRRTET